MGVSKLATRLLQEHLKTQEQFSMTSAAISLRNYYQKGLFLWRDKQSILFFNRTIDSFHI